MKSQALAAAVMLFSSVFSDTSAQAKADKITPAEITRLEAELQAWRYGNKVDATLGIDYQMTKDLSLNASYTFTLLNSNIENTSYYRNRVSVGGTYAF